MMIPFISLKTVSMTFFSDGYAQYFFFPKESMCFTSIEYLFDSDLL